MKKRFTESQIVASIANTLFLRDPSSRLLQCKMPDNILRDFCNTVLTCLF